MKKLASQELKRGFLLLLSKRLHFFFLVQSCAFNERKSYPFHALFLLATKSQTLAAGLKRAHSQGFKWKSL